MDPPRLFIVLLEECLVRLSPDIMVSHRNYFINQFIKLDILSSLGSTDGHRDFSSAQAGRGSISRQSHRLRLTLNWPACVRNKLTLREQGSLSRSQGSLLLEPSGTIDFYFNI